MSARPIIERWREKVDVPQKDGRDDPGPCWKWTAAIRPDGYGQMSAPGPRGTSPLKAHRVSYEHFVGPIPDELEVDHLCRNRDCVNPFHLEVVTRAENIARGIGPKVTSKRHAAKTHCPQGHRYDEANTYVYRGARTCRRCRRERAREARRLQA